MSTCMNILATPYRNTFRSSSTKFFVKKEEPKEEELQDKQNEEDKENSSNNKNSDQMKQKVVACNNKELDSSKPLSLNSAVANNDTICKTTESSRIRSNTNMAKTAIMKT